MGGIGHHGAAQVLTDRASWAPKFGTDGAGLNSGGRSRRILSAGSSRPSSSAWQRSENVTPPPAQARARARSAAAARARPSPAGVRARRSPPRHRAAGRCSRPASARPAARRPGRCPADAAAAAVSPTGHHHAPAGTGHRRPVRYRPARCPRTGRQLVSELAASLIPVLARRPRQVLLTHDTARRAQGGPAASSWHRPRGQGSRR